MFNLRSLDLNLLTVFEAVYELGTVSGAADRLALSKSATSHALSRLREACKDDLFVRAHQGLSPTPVATTMYPAIKQALEALRTSLAQASGFDLALSQRHFLLSIPHPMGPFYALDLRAAAAAGAPSIVLSFETVSRPIGLEDNLRDGFVDVVIGATRRGRGSMPKRSAAADPLPAAFTVTALELARSCDRAVVRH